MKRMEDLFKKIDVKELEENFFKITDDEWMLITAGKESDFNTMTASWGTFGILWNKPVAVCFIRPHRHTFGFAEAGDFFTLSFFERKYRKVLSFCGSKSGRDTDKIKETGLVPLVSENGGIGFEQSRMMIECKKIYADFIKEDHIFSNELISRNYPGKDFHKFFIGEITACFVKS